MVRSNQPADLWDIEFTKAKRARSTGERSQNSHTHGHYADISEQLSNETVHYSPQKIGDALKRMAVKDGYWPYVIDELGEPILDPITRQFDPISEADATSAQAASLIEYIHAWADTNGLWLTEYIDGTPTKVYGGSR